LIGLASDPVLSFCQYYQFAILGSCFELLVACVASVSVGFSAHSRRFSLFGGAKIGARATLMEAAGRGRGRGRRGEKRKCLPANPMILKNAPLALSWLDIKIHSVTGFTSIKIKTNSKRSLQDLS